MQMRSCGVFIKDKLRHKLFFSLWDTDTDFGLVLWVFYASGDNKIGEKLKPFILSIIRFIAGGALTILES